MITPYLEQLIWEGKAIFRTFNAGGSEKSILTVNENTFIVIIGCTYFPRNADDDFTSYTDQWAIEQLTIQSERAQNVLVFRNQNNSVYNSKLDKNTPVSPGTSTSIDLYLIHNTNVTFSFSDGQKFTSQVTSNTPIKGTAFSQPLDYGKISLAGGPIPVILNAAFSSGKNIDFTGTRQGTYTFSGLKFPVSAVKSVSGSSTISPSKMPLAIISYIEVSGALPRHLH